MNVLKFSEIRKRMDLEHLMNLSTRGLAILTAGRLLAAAAAAMFGFIAAWISTYCGLTTLGIWWGVCSTFFSGLAAVLVIISLNDADTWLRGSRYNGPQRQ